ncbi:MULTISPECIES: response regulator transcription factor [Gordonia]|uniref:response regulator transcription factor n=1 Tax=Gordonia TaxID=2053 RepID=UPI00257C7DF8|nr:MULTISPECIES: response regulator transcription factor [Gordonia]
MVNSEESESRIVLRRIGVIDDHDSVIEGLRGFFADTDDLRLVVGAHTVGDLLAQLTSDSPDMGLPLDLVVLDLRLGDGSTPAGNIAELSEAGVSTLVYTSGDEPYLVRDAAGAGTLGVVRKNATKTEVCAAVRTAASGSTVVSMDWAAALDSDPQFVDLPTRLREVLELYASGGSGAHVARVMGLSPDTVNKYIERIRSKYREVHRDAPTKTDLYKRAVEDGWLPMPRRNPPK